MLREPFCHLFVAVVTVRGLVGVDLEDLDLARLLILEVVSVQVVEDLFLAAEVESIELVRLVSVVQEVFVIAIELLHPQLLRLVDLLADALLDPLGRLRLQVLDRRDYHTGHPL